MIRVGPAGWHYKDWHGIVYPGDKPDTFQELTYIASLFHTAEVNSTFYNPPVSAMVEGWVKKTAFNPLFIFTVKLWQRFTHHPIPFELEDVSTVTEGLMPLAEAGRLGALLVQFPWRFKNDEKSRSHVGRVAEAFNGYPLIYEFRHQSWDNEAVRRFISDFGHGITTIDQPVIGKSIAPTPLAVGSIAYIRLHGRNYRNWFADKAITDKHPLKGNARYDYLYTPEEIKEWAVKSRSLDENRENTFVIQNNHPWGQAVANGLMMKAALGEDLPSLPDSLLKKFPELASLPTPRSVQGSHSIIINS